MTFAAARAGLPAVFNAVKTVAKGLRGADPNAVYGRLAGGLKQGSDASKLGGKIVPAMADDIGVSPGMITRAIRVAPDSTGASGMVPYNLARGQRISEGLDKFADTGDAIGDAIKFADGIETVPIPGITAGDVGQNLAARFGNAITGPNVESNLIATGIGVAFGQNPVVALGSNILGNRAGAFVRNRAIAKFGPGSTRAAWAGNLANVGTSIGTGMAAGMGLEALFGGGGEEQPTSATEQEAQMRQAQSQMMSQRQMPSNGGMRQMADLQGASGAYQRPLPPDGRSLQMADRPSMVMADIPMLDAATADKLRKRAIENAQGNIFSATQLGSYMEGM